MRCSVPGVAGLLLVSEVSLAAGQGPAPTSSPSGASSAPLRADGSITFTRNDTGRWSMAEAGGPESGADPTR